MRVLRSARRHGISDDEMHHAWDNAVTVVPYEYHGEERLLVIGPGFSGQMLELVAVPSDAPSRLIHADQLRPSRYKYLR